MDKYIWLLWKELLAILTMQWIKVRASSISILILLAPMYNWACQCLCWGQRPTTYIFTQRIWYMSKYKFTHIYTLEHRNTYQTEKILLRRKIRILTHFHFMYYVIVYKWSDRKYITRRVAKCQGYGGYIEVCGIFFDVVT